MAISVLLGVISRYKSGYPKNDLSLLSPMILHLKLPLWKLLWFQIFWVWGFRIRGSGVLGSRVGTAFTLLNYSLNPKPTARTLNPKP